MVDKSPNARLGTKDIIRVISEQDNISKKDLEISSDGWVSLEEPECRQTRKRWEAVARTDGAWAFFHGNSFMEIFLHV